MTMGKKHLEQAISGIESHLDNNGIFTGYTNKSKNGLPNDELEFLQQINPKFAVLYQGVGKMLEKFNITGNQIC